MAHHVGARTGPNAYLVVCCHVQYSHAWEPVCRRGDLVLLLLSTTTRTERRYHFPPFPFIPSPPFPSPPYPSPPSPPLTRQTLSRLLFSMPHERSSSPLAPFRCGPPPSPPLHGWKFSAAEGTGNKGCGPAAAEVWGAEHCPPLPPLPLTASAHPHSECYS